LLAVELGSIPRLGLSNKVAVVSSCKEEGEVLTTSSNKVAVVSI
jgi:hypothetical protein